jgi:hypothetical protein
VKTWDWRPRDLFDASLGWIAGRAERVGRARVACPPDRGDALTRRETSASVETAVSWELEGCRVVGTSHLPHDAAGARLRVVILPAGEATRSIPLYVTIARELAARGWPVLRMDARGIGESEGELDCGSVAAAHRMIQSGGFVPDTLAAMDHLDATLGRGRYVLTGLCGGAITAVFAAALDRRVAGIAPIDVRLHYTVVPAGAQPAGRRYLSWSQIVADSERLAPLLRVRGLVRGMRAIWSRISAGVRGGGRADGRTGHDWLVERLGGEANRELVGALDEVIRARLPVGFFYAETGEDAHLERIRDKLPFAGSESEDGTAVRVVAGADHDFTAAGSDRRLLAHLVEWLAALSRTGASR